MSSQPKGLLKLAKKFFSPEEQSAFLDCFENPPPRETSLIWLKENHSDEAPEFSFQPSWVQRPRDEKPGSTLEHERGDYYILDSSSVFAASPLLSIESPSIIFDACAAPGGKSIFAWRAHHPDLLIANEFVEKRLKPLISNLQRCQIKTAEVFHLPTKRIGEMFEACFPLVLIDSPCSGQSLILKGENVAGAFHAQTINGNAMRQRRILAELAPSVASQGHILYMTCTFSPEENEDIIKWFLKKFSNFEAISVPHLQAYQSALSDFPSYRLWPQQGKGAGAFSCLLKNKDEGTFFDLPKGYKPVWQNR